MRYVSLFFLFGLSFGFAPLPGQVSQLQFSPEVGQTLRYLAMNKEIMYDRSDTVQGQKLMQNLWTLFGTFKVLQVLEDGSYEVQFTLTRAIALQHSGGQSFTYDSDSSARQERINGILQQQYEPLLHNPIWLKISSNGKLREASQPQPILNGEPLSALAMSWLSELPTETVDLGSQWYSTTRNPRIPARRIRVAYRIEQLKEHEAVLAQTSTLFQNEPSAGPYELQYQGQVRLERATGWPLSINRKGWLRSQSPVSGDYYLYSNFSLKRL